MMAGPQMAGPQHAQLTQQPLLLAYLVVTHPFAAPHTTHRKPSKCCHPAPTLSRRMCSRFCLRALASATFLIGRASMERSSSRAALYSSGVICGRKYQWPTMPWLGIGFGGLQRAQSRVSDGFSNAV